MNSFLILHEALFGDAGEFDDSTKDDYDFD